MVSASCSSPSSSSAQTPSSTSRAWRRSLSGRRSRRSRLSSVRPSRAAVTASSLSPYQRWYAADRTASRARSMRRASGARLSSAASRRSASARASSMSSRRATCATQPTSPPNAAARTDGGVASSTGRSRVPPSNGSPTSCAHAARSSRSSAASTSAPPDSASPSAAKPGSTALTCWLVRTSPAVSTACARMDSDRASPACALFAETSVAPTTSARRASWQLSSGALVRSASAERTSATHSLSPPVAGTSFHAAATAPPT
jgi:hypothetical protein